MLNKKKREQIREALVERYRGLLEDHESEVFGAYRKAFEVYDGSGAFKFKVPFQGYITVDHGKHVVGGSLSLAVREKFEAVEVTIGEEDMFDADGEAKAEVVEAAGGDMVPAGGADGWGRPAEGGSA